MARWIFEPGHTEAEFRARHMMVTWVRGLFKDIHGSLTFDPYKPNKLSLRTSIDAATLWTGVQQRDDHLRSADFLDVEKHSKIVFKTTGSERTGASDYVVSGDLTIRGVTKPVDLAVRYLGSWQTSYWTDTGDQGPITRLGFAGSTRINRHDFKVDWNDALSDKGVVVSHDIYISFDIQALPADEIKKIEDS